MADETSPKQAKASKSNERSPKSRRKETTASSSSRNGKNNRSARARKRKRRFIEPTEKLPTPPPDPREESQEKTDSGERSPKRKSLEDKENAFQQLDKLHSMMEQMLELRAKNARLFHRIRELERFKALKRLEASTKRTFIHGDLEPMAPEEDVGFAESLLSAMLESSATSSSSNQSTAGGCATTASQQVARVKSFRAPMARQRSRSIGTEASPLMLPCNATKRASCHLQYGSAATALSRSAKRNSLASTLGLASIPPKVSKWTKVKAAFKWEKAGTGTAGASLGNLVVEALEQDAARFLKIPDAQDICNAATTNTTPSGSSPRTAEHSGPPSPATISSSSSIDDIYAGIQKRIHAARPTTRETEEDPTRRSRSLDGEIIIPQNIQYAQQHSRDSVVRRLDKGHKSAWGMVKEIIQSRRESVRRPLPRTSVRSEDGYSLSSHESSDMIHEIAATSDQSASSQVQVTVSESSLSVASPKPSSPGGNSSEIIDLASRRLTPTLTITVPSSEELRVSSPESCMSVSPILHRQLDSMDERSPSEEPDSASSPKPQTPRPTATLGERRRYGGQNAIDKQPPQPPLPRLQRQDSKWNKVKRAFLTGASSVPPSPSRTSSFFDETDGGDSYSASAEDLDNNGGVSPSVQSDIQRNYQILHDKLSVEFNRKLAEWEKMKNSQSSGSTSRASATSPKEKDSANALLMGEEQLTPEFKKKLQEWKRIKKTGNSPSGTTSPENQLFRRRLTDWNIWRTPAKSESKTPESELGKAHLSEDFMKKMEEWKKIKSTRSDEEQSIVAERRGSAELIQQARKISHRWKTLDEKEFQPLDRVIAMIEREQKMIQKRRDRFLDHKLRLNNLTRVLDSTPAKREILVHTSTGYYKFEGISQEFTKKLYEWEKSQGIKPESSTLQLLHPTYKISSANKNSESNHDTHSRSFKRSKSMSSVVESSQRDETPIRQPSSLSLNDATNLENGAKLRIDSKQTIGDEEMSEELVLDDSEPEAVIVDIEDVIEETASPMAKFQPQQTPVYCVTASETTSIAIPLGTVTASHEPSPVILVQAGETHHRVRKHCRFSTLYDEHEESKNSFESYTEATQSTSRTNTSDTNDENRRRIFDANDINICETIIEEEVTSLHIGEESSPNAEMSSATQTTHNELIEPLQSTTKTINPIMNATKNTCNGDKPKESVKRFENGSIVDPESLGLSSIDSERKLFKTFINSGSVTKENGGNNLEKCVKTNEVIPNCNSRDTSNDIEIDDVVITVSSDVRPKKVLKTRRLTDTQVGYKWRQSCQQTEEKSPEPTDELTVSTFPETPSVERIIINESTLNKIVVPTNSNEQLANIVPSSEASNSQNATDVSEEEPYCRRITSKSESTSVFVKTKRMIFSPFSRRNAKDKTTATSGPQKPEIVEVVETKKVEKPQPENQVPSTAPASTPVNNNSISGISQKILNIQRSRSSSECPITNERRPPLPQSPILARKDYRRSSPKETAPSIRMMIQRYNQKLQEESGSPASSGSGSPIWRSPTSERRVRNQMERYQEEVRRAIAGSSRYGLQERMRLEKSASAGLIQPSSLAMAPITASGVINSRNEILKSTSADFVRNPDSGDGKCEVDNEAAAAAGKRKNSLQNRNPEIFSNIKQCLAPESKTLPMRSDSSESQSRKSSMGGSESVLDHRSSGKISPDLIHKLNALTSAASEKLGRFCDENQSTASENSTPLGIRAQRVQQAKDDFMSRGPSCHSHDPSIDSSSRLSQVASSSMEFIKSASAGMIHVDSRTYERVQTNESRSGTLSKIASKFRRAKLRRAKDKDKDKDKMSTVSMLCRQSLLVDIQNGEMSKSCPTSPRDDDEHYSRFKQHRESN